MKTTTFISLILLFISSAFAQTEDTLLEVTIVEKYDTRSYDDYIQMLQKEGPADLKELDSIEGYAFWSDKIAIRKGQLWTVLLQTSYYLKQTGELEEISVDFLDITQDGSTELIVKFRSIVNGSRGGSELEYLQIWDAKSRTVLLDILTLDYFAWFSTTDGQQNCERKISYGAGEIVIGAVKCTDGELAFDYDQDRYASDTNENRIYRLVDGSFVLEN